MSELQPIYLGNIPSKDFNPYVVLGLPKDCKVADIRDAFLRKVKETHPDNGGSKDAFIDVRRAFFILIDPDRRKLYDTTGCLDEETGLEFQNQVTSLIVKGFEELIQNGTAWKNEIDLIKVMKTAAKQNAVDLSKKVDTSLDEVKKLNKLKSRIKKQDGENLFHNIINTRIKRLNSEIDNLNRRKSYLLGVEQELSAYNCATEMVQQVSWVRLMVSSDMTSTMTGSTTV